MLKSVQQHDWAEDEWRNEWSCELLSTAFGTFTGLVLIQDSFDGGCQGIKGTNQQQMPQSVLDRYRTFKGVTTGRHTTVGNHENEPWYKPVIEPYKVGSIVKALGGTFDIKPEDILHDTVNLDTDELREAADKLNEKYEREVWCNPELMQSARDKHDRLDLAAEELKSKTVSKEVKKTKLFGMDVIECPQLADNELIVTDGKRMTKFTIDGENAQSNEPEVIEFKARKYTVPFNNPYLDAILGEPHEPTNPQQS